MKKWAILGVSTLVFAFGGYLLYACVGCEGGFCPLASSPIVSTLLGGVIGIVIGKTLNEWKDPDANL